MFKRLGGARNLLSFLEFGSRTHLLMLQGLGVMVGNFCSRDEGLRMPPRPPRKGKVVACERKEAQSGS